MRLALNDAGFPAARIVASSGFGPEKCRMMAAANAPIDVIGTGSYLPELWAETYATADIVAYGGEPMVKKGREFLPPKRTASYAPGLAALMLIISLIARPPPSFLFRVPPARKNHRRIS